MSELHKLECLRLAIALRSGKQSPDDLVRIAKIFHRWVSEDTVKAPSKGRQKKGSGTASKAPD